MKHYKKLPQKELERISAQFYGKEYTKATPEKKKEYDDRYRKVEADTNRQIELAGGVEAWYLSGQGRLMEFETSDSNGIRTGLCVCGGNRITAVQTTDAARLKNKS